MRILVTNDDGIFARGLWALAQALAPLGEVTVVAPDREQSGVGSAISLSNPVRVTEVAPQVNHLKTYAVEGTPADSVILGLEWLLEKPVDLVVSGINAGANLGNDILLSGTVGAALQAHFRGIAALAVSVTALKEVKYEVAAELARLLAMQLHEEASSEPLFLNVNLPNVSLEQIRGVEITRMAQRTYVDSVHEGHDEKRSLLWITRHQQSEEQLDPGTDRWATRENRISITPLNINWTHKAGVERLSGLGTLLNRRLQNAAGSA